MKSDELSELQMHLRATGMDAIMNERYLMRRAWGLYYGIWALSILLFEVDGYGIFPIESQLIQNVVYVSIDVAIIAVAMYVTSMVFGKAKRLSLLRRDLDTTKRDNKRRRKYAGPVVFIFILLAALIIGSSLLRTPVGVTLEVGALFAVGIYIHFNQKATFESIPLEGRLAVIVFLASDLASGLSVVLTKKATYFGLLWIPTIIMWTVASFASIYYSVDDLMESKNQEE